MNDYLNLSRYDIENKLSSGQLIVSRIIGLAITAGPFIFLLVIFLLYFKNEPTATDYEASDFITILIYVFIVIAIGTYGAFLFIPQFFLKAEYLHKRFSKPMLDQKRNEIEDPVQKLFFLDRTLMVIQLALLEGVSILGMVVLFVSVMMGYIYTHSLLWLLVVPWLFQAIYTIQNFLSKEKYLDRIENNFLIPLRSYSE